MTRRGGILLAVCVALLLTASPAQAGVGTPSLYFVPSVVRPDSGFSYSVSFGWSEVTFDNSTSEHFYHLDLRDNTTGVVRTADPRGNGDTSQDNSYQFTGVFDDTHNYTVTLYAYEIFDGTDYVYSAGSSSATFTFDNSGPPVDRFRLDPDSQYTNIQEVQILIDSPFFSDATQYQIDTDSSGFECTSGAQDECPGTLDLAPSGNYHIKYVVRTIPAGEGPHTIYGRLRDGAAYTKISRQPIFFGPLPGNAGAVKSMIVNLDTTPPVPKLNRGSGKYDGVAGQPVTVNATSSTDSASGVDPDGFEWHWGDGSADQTASPGKMEHTFPGPGTYDGRVIVHDQSGSYAHPERTNFDSIPFTVTVTPAPVGEEPTPTPSPEPIAATPSPSPSPSPTPPPDDGPLGPKPDIPLEPLPQQVKNKKGALAAMKAPTQVDADQKRIGVRLSLRDTATVKLRLVHKGDVVARKKVHHKAGRFTAKVPTPEPGKYKLIAKAGKHKLVLPITVTEG